MRKKIIRLLGIGFDADDGHIRVSTGNNYDVVMGSDESHEFLQKLIQRIDDEIKLQNRSIEEVTPGELADLIAKLKQSPSN